MYSFSTVNENLGVSTLYHSFNDSALCIVIEKSEWNSSQKKDKSGFDKLLLESFQSIKLETSISKIPTEFANTLDSLLREQNIKTGQNENTVNFTGVALTKNKIFVCTAGVCRIHLVSKNKLLRFSKDHNFVNDFLDATNQQLNLNYEKDSSLFLSQTRMLGSINPDNKPPETVQWEVEDSYKILICSTTYHQFRNPIEYVDSFLSSDLLNMNENETKIGGFLAIIKRTNEDYLEF
ncbi:MAG: hypothetical protein LUM44_11250 [Pyrinomonadaceae bacterium]|nr:hypothetical protein [Pyrinomonadaceae bacterium]